ncbi:TIR domain-containing protein [Amycolatopsis balhimycina DSM 5908]|uniref:TIR domain-containing protein n=1 Tax=Amycolatopsis balhimycina DSM 5908 TaxID=1081091 RepID=A0A428WAA4_AMYBA|nr:toll/interleukin-1 receptor domain-containing protein [Amycolatopsis balhimycina]RSM40038.1 TIR domain-containing protein [Amycolatopsis balhimycina DSM 5908]
MSGFQGTVFVNYRVGDEAAFAAALAEQLKARFGRSEVFHVSQEAAAGSLFAEEIEGAIARCAVLIVVIGERWLNEANRRKLHEPTDWVRREIRLALDAGKRVVPLLVDTPMPVREHLPTDIRGLLDRQYRPVNRRSSPQDIERVVTELIHTVPELGTTGLPGTQELAAWWEEWSRRTDPALPAGVLLAGRAAEAGTVRKPASEVAGATVIQGESEELALAFIAAVFTDSTPDGLRTILVHDADAWTRCIAIARSCVLVPWHKDPDIKGAVARGHRVLLPVGPGRRLDSEPVRLPHLQQDDVRAAFEASGATSAFSQAYAPIICRSVTEFRSRFSAHIRPASDAEPLPKTEREVLSNAVNQGPLRHLGVEQDNVTADAMAKTDPARAATGYRKVADVLSEAGFDVHARDIRAKQAQTLLQAGFLDEGAAVHLTLMWKSMNETGDTIGHVSPFERQNEGHADDCKFGRALAVARAAERVCTGLTGIGDQLAAPFDALRQDDPHLLDAAVFLAEHAIAEGETEVVEQRLERLTSLSLPLPRRGSREEDLAVRLSMCVADVTGEWAELHDRALQFGPEHRAWILARKARSLSFTDDFVGAIRTYQDAIARALTERMNDEAADWLYALRALRVREGTFFATGDTEHPFAQHLRNGTWSHRLPGSPTLEERALRSIAEGKGRQAVRLLTQWRWKACVRGDLVGEMGTSETLGSVLKDNDEPLAGLRELVRAEAGKIASLAAAELPEAALRWPVGVAESTAGQLGAALEVAAVVGDLLGAEDAAAWIAVALDLIEGRGPRPTLFSHLVTRATKALVALGPRLDESQARRVLTATEPWIPRDESTGRHTDTDHARLLIGIAGRHPGLAGLAVQQLLEGAVFNDDFGGKALCSGLSLLEKHKECAEAILLGPAEAGNRWARSVLVRIGVATDRIRERVAATARAVIDRERPQPGVMSIWGYNTWLVATSDLLDDELRAELVAALLRQALDPAEGIANRRDTLDELAGIAPDLSSEERKRAFDAVLPLMGDDQPLSGHDLMMVGMQHPLSFMRVNFGPNTTTDTAVRACAYLADTEEERNVVRRQAIRLLARPDEIEVKKIVQTLLVLNSSADDLPPDLLATHMNEHVRALAAVLWAQSPTEPEPGLSLARDPARIVRASLADALTDRLEHAPIRDILAADPRLSIRERAAPQMP